MKREKRESENDDVVATPRAEERRKVKKNECEERERERKDSSMPNKRFAERSEWIQNSFPSLLFLPLSLSLFHTDIQSNVPDFVKVVDA